MAEKRVSCGPKAEPEITTSTTTTKTLLETIWDHAILMAVVC